MIALSFIDVLLIITASLLLCLGIWQFFLRPAQKRNNYLGAASILLCLSIFQALYLRVPQSERWNVLLLLPFGSAILIVLLIAKYIELLSSRKILPKILSNSITVLAIIEISCYLMPLGVLIYTSRYERPMLDFLFKIRNIFFVVAIAFMYYTAYRSLRMEKLNNIKLPLIKHVPYFLLVSASVILVSMVLQLLGLRVKIIYLSPLLIGTVALVYINIANIILQYTKQDADRIPDKTENRNYSQILALLETEKMYIKQDLRLADIAERLSLSANYVSKIVSDSGTNFNDLVNSYRVNAFIEKLKNKEDSTKTIMALAEEAGFQSKTTFLAAFKKVTGKTPSQFKESEIL